MADSSSSKLAEQAYSDEISFKSNMLFPMPLEENENLDSLNDETFGSGSFDSEWVDSDKPDKMVDEFEQWKKQQKAISKKGIPLDEAPLQIPSEEKMAQAISKLDNLGIATPKLEQEDPLPNAHAIEALWPTSPKHSSNIVSPDHSPYHMTDLLSPTHNIWGSPTSDEKISIDMDEKLADHTKNCLDQEDNRKPFSPVLEDEAIVSALPKRISKPIRVEDVEKMGFGHQVNQLPPHLRPFANGVPKVRPPPGFPPNMNPRSPFPMHPPGPYGPPPIPAVPQNVAQAQAQALYTAMMNQRMPFPQPFPRTPPSQPPHFPRPVYHSDPGHLRQRGPPMPIPHQHGRFITPQPRNTWNNQRVGRNQDNRRRQQNFSESPGLKYIPQYYVSSDDDDEGDKGTLMTAKEKDWIIRIQLMQLTSDKPELDDYYFHTFERRRLAKERSQSTTGVELETNHTNKDIKMTLPHVTKGDHNYKPTKFEGSLGQVSVGSVFHPREVVQVGDSGKPKGPVGSLKETKKKYQLLLTIEKVEYLKFTCNLHFELVLCFLMHCAEKLEEPVNPLTTSYYTLTLNIVRPAQYIRQVMVIVQKATGSPPRSENIKTSKLRPFQTNTQDPYITAYLKTDELPSMFVIGDGKSYSSDTENYFNQHLTANSSYIVFMRYFESQDSYYSTEWSSSFKTIGNAPVCAHSKNSELFTVDKTRLYLLIPLVILALCFLLSMGVIIYQRRLIRNNAREVSQMKNFGRQNNKYNLEARNDANINEERVYETPVDVTGIE
ncbi:protein PAT1 homolog 1-like [Dendronephthya gigantea]|uniref:protein PAT1 homolog 1-like n=1 Tax=Dendronephthya gigantea TaxID=151771 RepID=UPI00106D6179|nr:protein PAT1 homolog 1-like [Dendronephthya gigantea]